MSSITAEDGHAKVGLLPAAVTSVRASILALVTAIMLLGVAALSSQNTSAETAALVASAFFGLLGAVLAAVAKRASVQRVPGHPARVLDTYAEAAGQFAACTAMSLGASLTALTEPTGGLYDATVTVVLLVAAARVAGQVLATDDRARRGL